MVLYRLRHIYDKPDYDLPDPLTLGYYSSVEEIYDAVRMYRALPGYCDYPNGFIIEECTLNTECIPSKIYEAYYSFGDYEDIYEYSGEIGVFLTESEATTAIKHFSELNKKLILNSPLKKEVDVFEYTVNEKYSLDAFL